MKAFCVGGFLLSLLVAFVLLLKFMLVGQVQDASNLMYSLMVLVGFSFTFKVK